MNSDKNSFWSGAIAPHLGEIWNLAGLHFGPLFLEIYSTDFGIFNLIDSTYSLLSILRFKKKSELRNSNKFRSKLEKNAISRIFGCRRRKYSKSRGRYNGLMLKFSPGGAVTVRDRPHEVCEVE